MNIVRLLLVSGGTWLVPFLVSFPFFSREGKLLIPIIQFKVVMMIVLVSVSSLGFLWLYSSWDGPKPGIVLAFLFGVIALFLNVLLDSFTVIRFQSMTVSRYVMEIGLIYLILVIISSVLGYLANQGA